MKKTNCMLLAFCCLLLVTAATYAIDAPARMKVLVPREHLTYNDLMGGTPAAYLYRASDDRFYTSTYGSNLGIRCFVNTDQYFPVYVENPLDRTDGKSWQCATESDLLRVASSLDVEGGLFDSDNAVSFYPGGMIMNPAPVTYNGIEYDTGELCVITAWGKAEEAYAVKRLLVWDFREIWSYTDQQPDRDNAEWDKGLLITDIFGKEYGIGRTNWNDAFSTLVDLQSVGDVIGFEPDASKTGDQLGSRQATFSSDGSKVYFVSKATSSASYRPYSGLYSVELATKTVKQLFDNSDPNVENFQSIPCEPDVVPIGVRNFTGIDYDPNFDQVMFNATDLTGNVGGLVCLVDDGSDNPPIHTVIDREQIMDFLEISDANYNDYDNFPEIWGVAADTDGTLFVYVNGPTRTVLKYDLEGRLSAVGHHEMLRAFHDSLGSTSTSTTFYRLQVRTVNIPAEDPNDPGMDIPQIMYMSVGGKCVAGIDVYPTCDFDLDGEVTVADMDFFKAQIQKSRTEALPTYADGQAFLDYIECDLNGSGYHNDDKDGLLEASVTEKDVEILYQFVKPGDTNLDGVVDATDQATVESNMNSTEGMGWSQGDFDFDDDVDADDMALLTGSMS